MMKTCDVRRHEVLFTVYADGAEVDMSAKMTIEGDAEIDASKVTLTVGGRS